MRIIANTLAGIMMLLVAVPSAFAQIATSTTRAVPAAGVLRVRVINLRDSTGQVICTLFNSPKGFPSDSGRAVEQRAVPIKADVAVCGFDGLVPGKYALVIFHDENSNGEFDRNWLGFPKEGYAFSNNVKPVFSPPSFNAAAFDYAGGDQDLTVVIRY